MKHKLMNTTDLANQDTLDFDEMIDEIEVDNNMSSDHILDSFTKKITALKRKRLQRKLAIASLAACFTIVAVANWNTIYSYASELLGVFTFETKDGSRPSVDVEPIHVNTPVLEQMGEFTGTKEYTSLEECSQELGITLLNSNLAWDYIFPGKVHLSYPNTEKISVATISVPFYIVGDLNNIQLKDGALLSQGGEIYKNVVNLTITFLIDEGPTKYVNEFDQTDYYSTETYVGSNGIEAQILGTSYDYGVYFFHENIKYEFRAMVPLDEVKRIIDSFE